MILAEQLPGARGGDSATLAGRALAGDLEAFEAIIRHWERPVLGLCVRLLGRLEDAEDAAQEVFLRLHRNLKQFDRERAFEPWLYRITVNACLDRRRQRPHQSLDEVRDETGFEPADPSPGADRALEQSERRRLLKRALRLLPERERAAVVLRDVEGLSTAEAARALGSSEQTVRSALCRARLKLKDLVERLERRTT